MYFKVQHKYPHLIAVVIDSLKVVLFCDALKEQTRTIKKGRFYLLWWIGISKKMSF